MITSITNGDFQKTLEIIETKEIIETIDNDPISVKGLCLKEIGEHEKALECFSKFPTYNYGELIHEIQIGCCYILKGEVTKGLNLVEKVEGLKTHPASLMDTGRALFEIGEFEKSQHYFRQVVHLDNTVLYAYQYSILDFICKIHLMEMVLTVTEDQFLYNLVSNIDPRLHSRVEMIRCCFCIDSDNTFQAFNICTDIIQKEHEIENCDRLLFLEPLMMAQYWKTRNLFFKALMVYQLIQRLQMEFQDIPRVIPYKKQKIDIASEIKFCILKLSNIFHFDINMLLLIIDCRYLKL